MSVKNVMLQLKFEFWHFQRAIATYMLFEKTTIVFLRQKKKTFS